MKRIFSIFLCAVIIAALFVTPFSASAAEDNILLGTWYFNEKVDLSVEYSWSNLEITVGSNSYVGLSITQTYSRFSFVKSSGGASNLYNGNQWTMESFRNVTFVGGTGIYDESLIAWVKANAVKTHNADGTPYVPECDGTCEVIVHDFDNDGICDDCGQPFTMTLRDTTYNFNGAMLPKIPEAEFMTYGYAIIEQDGEDVYLHFSTVGTRAENNYIMYTGAGNRLTYELVGDEWTNSRTYTIANNEVITTGDEILWSNHTITDKDNNEIIVGDTNFPLPLWMEMEKITQGEMPSLTSRLGGNLMTLTLCGVGLITLLVGLYLLLRTFKRYQR